MFVSTAIKVLLRKPRALCMSCDCSLRARWKLSKMQRDFRQRIEPQLTRFAMLAHKFQTEPLGSKGNGGLILRFFCLFGGVGGTMLWIDVKISPWTLDISLMNF